MASELQLPWNKSDVSFEDTTEDVFKDWLPPTGLVGEIATYIYQSAYKTIPETALAAAIALTAGIAGRAYNVNGDGLVHYIVLLAPAGAGKDASRSGIKKLCGHLSRKYPQIPLPIGLESIASAPALHKFIAEQQLCSLSLFGEVGNTFQQWCNKKASPNDIALRGLLLTLFSSCGSYNTLGKRIYSDSNKNVPTALAPAFSFLGESTQAVFYNAIDQQSISDGLLPRLSILESTRSKLPEPNHSAGGVLPSDQLLDRLRYLIVHTREIEAKAESDTVNRPWVNVPFNADALNFRVDLEKTTRHKMERLNSSPDAYLAEIMGRIEQKVNRTAALLAVGVNPDNPVITINEMNWAHNFVMHGNNVLLNRFRAGEVGQASHNVDQHKLILQLLKDFYTKSWSPRMEQNYGINQFLHGQHLISYRYIYSYLHKRPAFKDVPNTRLALLNILENCVNEGYLKVKISPTKDYQV